MPFENDLLLLFLPSPALLLPLPLLMLLQGSGCWSGTA